VPTTPDEWGQIKDTFESLDVKRGLLTIFKFYRKRKKLSRLPKIILFIFMLVNYTYTNTYFGVLKQNILFIQCLKINIVGVEEVPFLHQTIKT